jgi:hypothetical protein
MESCEKGQAARNFGLLLLARDQHFNGFVSQLPPLGGFDCGI